LAQHRFTVKLSSPAGLDSAAFQPPFDVVKVFQRKGRVPVKGTINGFPFRSSLMNMGEGHMMVVNAQMRAGAQCRAGDTVTVIMELDEEKRTVELSADLKKIIHGQSQTKEAWSKLSFTHQKEHVKAIEAAKKPATREKRIAAMLESLHKPHRKK
jgi:Domain of unknown function (DUF1905)/Bacteriocin-protection, YdeI or OmpD-Associated